MNDTAEYYNTGQYKKKIRYTVEYSFTNQVVERSSPVAVISFSDIAPVSSKEFLDIQVITECRFTLNAYMT